MKSKERAFCRTDVLFCVFGVSLLFAMAASLCASSKSESQRAICFNNLRQIGRAFHVWGSDHDDRLPWQVSYTLGTAAGTGGNPLSPNTFFQYSWVSNQLGTPKILVCPADSASKKIASNWGTSPAGGFLHINYRNNSFSYPLMLHATANSPASLLSADRNFRVDQLNSGCSYVPFNACFTLFSPANGGVGAWTNALHGVNGHLLFMDGSVTFSTSAQLQQAIAGPGQDDNGAPVHGLPAF